MASSPHAPDALPTSAPGVAAASRYWTFQTIEAALVLTMAAGLVALAPHLVQRHV